MHSRPFARAAVLAAVALVALAGVASADSLRSDGDALTAGAQSTVDLGEVSPSATVTVTVGFELTCAGTRHPDPSQSITLARIAAAAPSGGAVVSVTPTTLGPVPDDWPLDGTECPAPLPVLTGGSSTVTLRAPAIPNVGYTYTVGYGRTLDPVGVDDTRAISGTGTSVVFRLTVVANTAPALALPTDVTVEADTTGGWRSVWTVSASDLEDDPDPAPICSPAAGEVLPLGTTTVACSATDTGGRTTSGSFDVTVVDTSAPALVLGGDQAISTADASGAVLHYPAATVSDVADPAPVVACDPADGTWSAVGTTTVTCTATDASGNVATATFDVVVTYVAPPAPEPGSTQPGLARGHEKGKANGYAWGHHKTGPSARPSMRATATALP